MSMPETQETGFTVSCRRLENAEMAALHAAGYPGDGFVIALSGELDLASAPVAEAELMRAEASQDLIVLDLRGLTFIDSTGLRLMIGADRRAHERGAAFVIVEGPPQVRRLFDLSGIAGHLEMIEDIPAEVAPTD
jgi:anti-sigma B factor antagonist